MRRSQCLAIPSSDRDFSGVIQKAPCSDLRIYRAQVALGLKFGAAAALAGAVDSISGVKSELLLFPLPRFSFIT